MSEVVRLEEGGLREVDPEARGVDLSIRLARQEDFAFIDALQKAESDKVGFMYEQAIRKRIEEGNVIVAEAPGSDPESIEPQRHRGHGEMRGQGVDSGCAATTGGTPIPPQDQLSAADTPNPNPQNPIPIGYCLGVDRYQKRSELGIIYQMAVAPAYRRCNVAAALLQAQFDKSAYGTRLYCCWCKQSLEANRFWQSMGFVPLAFRAGARPRNKRQAKEPVVHVFWQKPVRSGDIELARRGQFRGWWYPYETQVGAMMEGRVVLPLPPEVGWDEAVPVVLPGAAQREAEQRLLAARVDEIGEREKAVKRGARRAGQKKGREAKGGRQAGGATRAVMGYGFGVDSGFGQAKQEVPAIAGNTPWVDERELGRLKEEKDAAKQALKAAQRRNDPELVAYARELRDRWQEAVAARPSVLGLRSGAGEGERYNVGRRLGGHAENEDTAMERAQALSGDGVKALGLRNETGDGSKQGSEREAA